MEHIGTKTIEAERLILRRFKLTDAKDMFNNYTSHAIVTEYLTWYPHKTLEDTQQYLLDEEFKNKLANTYFKQLSYNGIKKSLFNSLDLMYWVLIKSKRKNKAKNYNQMFNKLTQDIEL